MDTEMTTQYFQENHSMWGGEPVEEEMEVEEEDDTEHALQHLKTYDNEKQLNLLRREIGHIIAHGLQPPEGWYDERFEYIHQYSQLDWTNLATRFGNKDQYLHDTAIYIIRLARELLDERETKPNFHLQTYHTFVHSVHAVWCYYKQVYAQEETDTDILDLIEGIKFM
jgi:hypothetical protein